jgi:hypothetical protein
MIACLGIVHYITKLSVESPDYQPHEYARKELA